MQFFWTKPEKVGRPSFLCRCLIFYIDRHIPLETRYGPAQNGPRLVPVQASWGRSGAGLYRSVPVPLDPGADRSRGETVRNDVNTELEIVF